MSDGGEHEALIRELAGGLTTVRRLWAPWLRALGWGLACAAFAGCIVAAVGFGPLLRKMDGHADEWCELAAAAATTLLAAYAAFTISIPGRERRWALLPVPALVLWLALSGAGCWRAETQGIDYASVHPPMSCFRFIVLTSLPLSLLMAWMLSRAYPLRPGLAAMLGGLAAAAAAAAMIDLVHPFDVTAEDLVAHMAAITVVILANRWIGARTLRRVVLAALAALAPQAGAAAAERPLVVELYTSQGCSSCPPADALLTEWAMTRPDVLPLAFHVDYWNSLGWTDPFSSAANTARERQHAAQLGESTVYTPELVLEGSRAVVGSDQAAAEAALASVRHDRVTAAEVTLRRQGGELLVSVGAGRGAASVLLVGYDRSHRTPIGRGENSGRTLLEFNIVRSLLPLGRWTGSPAQFHERLQAGERFAALLETQDGTVVGAAIEPAQ